MSRTTTLAVIRRRARELADMEDTGADNYVDDTELNGMINASLGLWHSMVAQAVPERYEASDTIAADGSANYALPADYYKTLGVEYEEDSTTRRDLKRVMFRERNRFERTTTGEAIGYRVSASTIVLMPAPTAGTYYHIYITHADVLAADGDTLDGVNGWEEWITFDVAIKLMLKDENHPGLQSAAFERNRIQADIMTAAAARNAGEARRVVDVRRRRNRYNVRGYTGGYDTDFWFNR